MADLICVVDARDTLGEGPCWDPSTQKLYWFDIKGRRLHWHSPEDGTSGEWPLPVRASAAAPRAAGGLVLATEDGLAVFDTRTGVVEPRQPLDEVVPGFRSNDGKIDLQGRFWWSVMDDAGGVRPGRLYRTGSDWVTEAVVDGIHIANAVAQSPDACTFYLADSAEQVLYAYDHDPKTGALSNRRVFAHTQGEAGTPDGAAMDADGYVWNAQWGAWRIVRYAPDGSVDRVVQTPVEQPTCCCFGGRDLDVLYVTSARDGLSEEALAGQPLAGALFAFDPGVRGLALPLFEG